MKKQSINWQEIFYKQVCQLDEDGVFLNETVAELDCYAKDGSYLIPANCVETTPPQPKMNHVAQWQPETQTWKYVPDFRGTTVYDTTTGTEIVIRELGELPENTTINPKPSKHHIWNENEWEIPVEIAQQLAQQQFQAAKSAKLIALNTAAQQYIAQATGTDKVPDFELQSWALQATEAKAWAQNSQASTPVLDGIAAARGIPADVLKQAALRKTVAYEKLTAHVVGERQALQTLIEAAKTEAELNTVVIAFTPPESAS